MGIENDEVYRLDELIHLSTNLHFSLFSFYGKIVTETRKVPVFFGGIQHEG